MCFIYLYFFYTEYDDVDFGGGQLWPRNIKIVLLFSIQKTNICSQLKKKYIN